MNTAHRHVDNCGVWHWGARCRQRSLDELQHILLALPQDHDMVLFVADRLSAYNNHRMAVESRPLACSKQAQT
jgi:hypothetical protein